MSHAQRAGTGKATRPAHGKRRLAAFVCVLALVLATTVSLPSRAWADADDDAWAGTAADAAEPEATDASEDEGDEPANTQDAVQSPLKTVRPSSSHQLYVEGTQLVDNEGNPAVLRGVSTHGLAWFPQYVNDKLFAQLSTEWDCNLVRLALYSEDYCKGGKEAEDALATLRRGIDACINNDMYVLVDWHILKDGNPNSNIEQAKVFFETIAKEYASSPNVLYEICNEPNGETSWSDVYAYAEQVIPIIRANSPHAVIIVGTPNYDREVASVSRKPLPFENVMYTLHFYATTHKEDLRGELEAALDTGVPVFVTECGLCEATGDGPVNFDSAVAWFELLDERKISYAVWSLSDKAESSAFIRMRSSATTKLTDKDLTPVGLWVRALIQGTQPSQIPLPAGVTNSSSVDLTPDWYETLGNDGIASVASWPRLALGALALCVAFAVAVTLYRRHAGHHIRTYDDLIERTGGSPAQRNAFYGLMSIAIIVLSSLLTLVYLLWRMFFSIPLKFGWLPVVFNVILLVVECFGFVESLIHYSDMMGIRDHPLPKIAPDEYPDVDIFIATYNEPPELLRRTINGCNHLLYPDKRKVHVWICDDNRRPAMRELAESMGVGYFDRPDNKGAKAGNLNHAMGLTSAPYVVTLDADMIVRRDFLLKTIPYFVDAEKRAATLPEDERVRLGLLQTPQCFYDPDVFQYALYSENTATNEQDFFYRTIEVAKTSSNSVIYGGSNTVLSRAALEAVGGFFTGSITEDFATGMLIESASFVSLGLSEPLASGRTPHTYAEHIQQRTRWGRGVIVTARKLHLLRRRGLTLRQKISYWSSVTYWYSPIKNLIYITSPLLFAVFNLPVFTCTWLDLIVYWLPMFLAQTICLRVVSKNDTSTKWSGIHETSVMAHLFVPIVKELFGITMSTFKVTDKTAASGRRTVDWRAMAPYLVLLGLSAIGIVRVCWLLTRDQAVGLAVLLFWLVRNSYYLCMACFLIDGRDGMSDVVRVIDAVPTHVEKVDYDGTITSYDGITTRLTEHRLRMYLDESESLTIGQPISVELESGTYQCRMYGMVIDVSASRNGQYMVHDVYIVSYETDADELEFWQVLYDRVPSLPQSLKNDFGALAHLWRNIAFRIANTVRR